MNPNISLGQFTIGHRQPPFIIAEMSGNHNQSLETAIKIVEAAARSGAHALKLQTYTADTLTIDKHVDEFYISDQSSLWYGKSLYELYQIAYTPWEWHEKIFNRCYELGIIPFSTPFDSSAVDFLESLKVPFYKIASFDNTNHSLIQKVSSTGKPVIISTGLANLAEISETVAVAHAAGCKNLILLKCTSTYPANPLDSNILTIPNMQSLFNCPIGLSDHTPGIGTAIASVALGACIIEKHFTLSRAQGGVDAAFSLEPCEMAQLVTESKRAFESLGTISYQLSEAEMASRMFRRSLYIVKDLKSGEQLSEENIRAIRPGFGLPPKYFSVLIGKKIKKTVKRGTPLSWQLID